MNTRPRFTDQISLGNVIQIGVILAAAVAAFVTFKSETEQNAREWREAATERSIIEREAAEERGKFDVRLRTLENQQARADERFSSILSYLARIDGRLERIEQDRSAR